MKVFAFLLTLLSIYAHAGELTLMDISPHLPADAPIIWKATNTLPNTFWTYERRRQHFSFAAVSNALALGAFDLTPLPKTFTKPITLWDKQIEGDPEPDYFTVEPNLGLVTFRRQRRLVAKGDATPAARLARTWQYAAQIGMDRTQLIQGATVDDSVGLSRRLDGVPFRDDMEGFSIQYGAQGEIRLFTLNWPKLERVEQQRTASPQDITRCIRAFKTPVLPIKDESDYFARIKTFASIRSLTITNLTAYYSEGRLGEKQTETQPETHVAPVAMLDAVAAWGSSNSTLRLLVPLTLPDVNRILR